MVTVTLKELFREITGGQMIEYKFGFDCYDNAEDGKVSKTDDINVWTGGNRENYCYVEVYAYSLEDAVKEVCGMIQRDRINVTNIEEVRSV